uniref:DNA-directed DNA polymerase n=1 Tax=Macrostomum lignano TaxID=282301 RepID=A0A1I8FPP8_9PLAT
GWLKTLLLLGTGRHGDPPRRPAWLVCGTAASTSGEPLPPSHWARQPIRQISGRSLDKDLQLTPVPVSDLVRSAAKCALYLDYSGLAYNIVEVNSVSRQQIRWMTDYRKVRGVVARHPRTLRLAGMSALESRIRDPSQSLAQLRLCLSRHSGREEGGKLTYPNRRLEKCFTPAERALVIYTGAAVMRLVSMRLRSKYNLHRDVRKSLYNELDAFLLNGVGKRRFRGGDRPDLSRPVHVRRAHGHGGHRRVPDAMDNCPKLRPWFGRMRAAVAAREGGGRLAGAA